MKTELVCSVTAETSETAQTDITTTCHLKEWQRYVHLSLVFPTKGALMLHMSDFYSSNNRL